VWVKSGLNHWYLYENGWFVGRDFNGGFYTTDCPIYISPAGPSQLPPWNGTPSIDRKPHPGSMYIVYRWSNGPGTEFWQAVAPQPYV